MLMTGHMSMLLGSIARAEMAANRKQVFLEAAKALREEWPEAALILEAMAENEGKA